MGIYRKEFGTGKINHREHKEHKEFKEKSPVPSLRSLRSLRLKNHEKASVQAIV
jgi:hypothetical protein